MGFDIIMNSHNFEPALERNMQGFKETRLEPEIENNRPATLINMLIFEIIKQFIG